MSDLLKLLNTFIEKSNEIIKELYFCLALPIQSKEKIDTHVKKIKALLTYQPKINPESDTKEIRAKIFQFHINQFLINTILLHLETDLSQSFKYFIHAISNMLLLSKNLRDQEYVGLDDADRMEYKNRLFSSVDLFISSHTFTFFDELLNHYEVTDSKNEIQSVFNDSKINISQEVEVLEQIGKCSHPGQKWGNFIEYAYWFEFLGGMIEQELGKKISLYSMRKKDYSQKEKAIQRIKPYFSLEEVVYKDTFSLQLPAKVSEKNILIQLTTMNSMASKSALTSKAIFQLIELQIGLYKKVSELNNPTKIPMDVALELFSFSLRLYSHLDKTELKEYEASIVFLFESFSGVFSYWIDSQRMSLMSDKAYISRADLKKTIWDKMYLIRKSFSELSHQISDSFVLGKLLSQYFYLLSMNCETSCILEIIYFYSGDENEHENINPIHLRKEYILKIIDYLFAEYMQIDSEKKMRHFVTSLCFLVSASDAEDRVDLIARILFCVNHWINKSSDARSWGSNPEMREEKLSTIFVKYLSLGITTFSPPMSIEEDLAYMIARVNPDRVKDVTQVYIRNMASLFLFKESKENRGLQILVTVLNFVTQEMQDSLSDDLFNQMAKLIVSLPSVIRNVIVPRWIKRVIEELLSNSLMPMDAGFQEKVKQVEELLRKSVRFQDAFLQDNPPLPDNEINGNKARKYRDCLFSYLYYPIQYIGTFEKTESEILEFIDSVNEVDVANPEMGSLLFLIYVLLFRLTDQVDNEENYLNHSINTLFFLRDHLEILKDNNDFLIGVDILISSLSHYERLQNGTALLRPYFDSVIKKIEKPGVNQSSASLGIIYEKLKNIYSQIYTKTFYSFSERVSDYHHMPLRSQMTIPVGKVNLSCEFDIELIKTIKTDKDFMDYLTKINNLVKKDVFPVNKHSDYANVILEMIKLVSSVDKIKFKSINLLFEMVIFYVQMHRFVANDDKTAYYLNLKSILNGMEVYFKFLLEAYILTLYELKVSEVKNVKIRDQKHFINRLNKFMCFTLYEIVDKDWFASILSSQIVLLSILFPPGEIISFITGLLVFSCNTGKAPTYSDLVHRRWDQKAIGKSISYLFSSLPSWFDKQNKDLTSISPVGDKSSDFDSSRDYINIIEIFLHVIPPDQTPTYVTHLVKEYSRWVNFSREALALFSTISFYKKIENGKLVKKIKLPPSLKLKFDELKGSSNFTIFTMDCSLDDILSYYLSYHPDKNKDLSGIVDYLNKIAHMFDDGKLDAMMSDFLCFVTREEVKSFDRNFFEEVARFMVDVFKRGNISKSPDWTLPLVIALLHKSNTDFDTMINEWMFDVKENDSSVGDNREVKFRKMVENTNREEIENSKDTVGKKNKSGVNRKNKKSGHSLSKQEIQEQMSKNREENDKKRKEREAEETKNREEKLRKRREHEERVRESVERKEREAKEREAKEREAKEREAKEREAKEREAKEREAKEREAKEREAKEREAKEREAKEREAKEREAKEREAKEREAKEQGKKENQPIQSENKIEKSNNARTEFRFFNGSLNTEIVQFPKYMADEVEPSSVNIAFGSFSELKESERKLTNYLERECENMCRRASDCLLFLQQFDIKEHSSYISAMRSLYHGKYTDAIDYFNQHKSNSKSDATHYSLSKMVDIDFYIALCHYKIAHQLVNSNEDSSDKDRVIKNVKGRLLESKESFLASKANIDLIPKVNGAFESNQSCINECLSEIDELLKKGDDFISGKKVLSSNHFFSNLKGQKTEPVLKHNFN